ncbi:MAG: IPT/TIG domain-containing protein, partial [Terriglobia bacterium]
MDGAKTWIKIDSPSNTISALAIDAQNPSIVWEIGGSLRKSTDAGATWNPVTFPGNVQSLVLDPRVGGTAFAISAEVFCGFFCTGNKNAQLYRTVDGGANWVLLTLPAPSPLGLTMDGSTNPSTLYDGLRFRSLDGGATWTPMTPPPGGDSAGGLTVGPQGTLYVSVSGQGNYISQDQAQTWTAIGSFLPTWTRGAGPSIINLLPAGSTGTGSLGTIYASTNQVATAGSVTKLSADGSAILYSTYLRGHPSMGAFLSFASESSALLTQNGISGIAVDAAGNITVAGTTRAVDFPVALAAQPANAGLGDAFAATISADGGTLIASTYFGGSGDDGALAVAVDSQGNSIFVGQTWSGDFPVPGGIQPPNGYGEAFVVKLAPSGAPAITSVLNGASYLPGIESGSWAMIVGTNLANTFPGRTWRSSEIVNGNLPTSLDGVSVTIDGKPAFVYYISPTQINVQAPSDTATGAVSVVVKNNGNSSAPATAQLQAAAPAFFMYPGTNFAVASRLPDYT